MAIILFQMLKEKILQHMIFQKLKSFFILYAPGGSGSTGGYNTGINVNGWCFKRHQNDKRFNQHIVPSGLVDRNKGSTLSWLHKAIKPLNQLMMIEDSLVIYRMSRAPERRIFFYIDVGNLPKVKGRAISA